MINLLTAPSADDFATTFTPQAEYRNANNTGPVQRVYVVTVSQENYEEMLAYGGLRPHTKYGTTTVYFFPEEGLYPTEVSPEKPHFPPSYRPACLAVYCKLGQGQERFE